ncbi:MAG: hypothetical protein AABW51_02735 [Nanoarchaeota archaeon]
MLKRLNKRGQFYLIAAIVIISLIIGFFLISNSSKKKENVRVYELSEQLKIEGKKVVDYGIINDNTKVKEFTKNFSDYAGEEIDVVYIVGNYSQVGFSYIYDIEIFKYNQAGQEEPVGNYINETKVTINLNSLNYTFMLNKGENFYFVMTQTLNGEKYVARN